MVAPEAAAMSQLFWWGVSQVCCLSGVYVCVGVCMCLFVGVGVGVCGCVGVIE